MLFSVNDVRYAAPVEAVERVVPAAAVAPLPGAPAVIHGAANIAGEVLPVFDLRRRLSLAARGITPDDRFLILHAADRKVILLIDHAHGLLQGAQDGLIDARRVAPDLQHVAGILISDDGLVLIHDVDAFLSAAESRDLDAAMASHAAHAT